MRRAQVKDTSGRTRSVRYSDLEYVGNAESLLICGFWSRPILSGCRSGSQGAADDPRMFAELGYDSISQRGVLSPQKIRTCQRQIARRNGRHITHRELPEYSYDCNDEDG